jgi:hypothetical protein
MIIETHFQNPYIAPGTHLAETARQLLHVFLHF